MSKPRKVTYARLQTGAYVTGAGELGSVFPTPNKTLENLSMSVSDLGLEIQFKYRGIEKHLLTPLANVIVAELAKDSKE
jgi:hypothetical protein